MFTLTLYFNPRAHVGPTSSLDRQMENIVHVVQVYQTFQIRDFPYSVAKNKRTASRRFFGNQILIGMNSEDFFWNCIGLKGKNKCYYNNLPHSFFLCSIIDRRCLEALHDGHQLITAYDTKEAWHTDFKI